MWFVKPDWLGKNFLFSMQEVRKENHKLSLIIIHSTIIYKKDQDKSPYLFSEFSVHLMFCKTCACACAAKLPAMTGCQRFPEPLSWYRKHITINPTVNP